MNYVWDIPLWILRQMPVGLRRTRMLDMLRALLAGVSYLHGAFLVWLQEQRFEQDIDGTVWQLERVLNQVFDNGLNRIYITQTDRTLVQLWKQAEGPEVQLYKASEGPLLQLFTTGEAQAEFIVHVPTNIWNTLTIIWPGSIRGYIERYKAAGPSYRIELI